MACACKVGEQGQRRQTEALSRLGDELRGMGERTFEAFNLTRPLEPLHMFGSLYFSPDGWERLLSRAPEPRRLDMQKNSKKLGTARQLTALQTGKQACLDFATNPRGWLCLHGAFGAGKSHLAAAIAHARAAAGEQVRYRSVPGLLDALKAGFDDHTSDAVFDDLLTCDLLVIDDLGAEHLSGWAREKLFRLLNERETRPTVLTSNCHPDDLAPPDDIDTGRLISRIVGNSRCAWLPISDYRRLRGQL